MTESGRWWFAATIAVLSSALFATESQAQDPPNVIFIMTDDVG